MFFKRVLIVLMVALSPVLAWGFAQMEDKPTEALEMEGKPGLGLEAVYRYHSRTSIYFAATNTLYQYFDEQFRTFYITDHAHELDLDTYFLYGYPMPTSIYELQFLIIDADFNLVFDDSATFIFGQIAGDSFDGYVADHMADHSGWHAWHRACGAALSAMSDEVGDEFFMHKRNRHFIAGDVTYRLTYDEEGEQTGWTVRTGGGYSAAIERKQSFENAESSFYW